MHIAKYAEDECAAGCILNQYLAKKVKGHRYFFLSSVQFVSVFGCLLINLKGT